MMVSFIIPAYNEEEYIESAIRSIDVAVGRALSYEVLVVDNGSSDSTAAIAAEAGATVVRLPRGLISVARNTGAALAKGDYLVFLDGDVTLTYSWLSGFQEVAPILESQPLILSGSPCSIPPVASWLEKVWFAPRIERVPGYLGGAHLILRRDSFESIGGFDESLETGEDYDFCVRLRRRGGSILPLPTSVAVHHGYPRTLGRFARREIWHGTGDCGSLSAILASRVAMTALGFAGLHVVVAMGLITGSWGALWTAVLCIVALCLLSAWRSIPSPTGGVLVVNAALYYVYYASRTLSFIRAWMIRRSARAG